ncbi:MAG: ABC transporter ATP-binding protein [Treponema sp.]|jgi:iron complex transport system ATP-binding protein|nr:ABC transporter ATP-binding protein [Treponema sp.]
MLELKNLSVGYKQAVVSAVDLSVGEGQFFALIGPNGAGKTTLLKTIAGFLRPLAGKVLIDRRDVSVMKGKERAGYVSYLPQMNAAYWSFTVREMVSQGLFHKQGLFGRESADDREAVEKALESANLALLSEKKVTELSGGEFQRVLIARSMVQGARLVLFDEPVNNLDPKWTRLTMDLVRNLTRKSVSALVSLHNLHLAAVYADRTAVVSNGVLWTIATEQTQNIAFMEEVFGGSVLPRAR